MSRIDKMLRAAGYVNGFGPFMTERSISAAVWAVLFYAAKNPGLGDVRAALRECYLLEVGDDDVIEASKRAFSGRLTLVRSRAHDGESDHYTIDYCTGQYWPTEYRAACAAVLHEAARLASLRRK